MKTIKGPAIFLAQFMGDKPPFDTLSGLADWAAGGVRGEVTVVVAGAEASEASAGDALELVRRARAGGRRRRGRRFRRA